MKPVSREPQSRTMASLVAFDVVSGPGVRMSIGGPQAPAKASCEQIATQMVRNGLRSAACVRPT